MNSQYFIAEFLYFLNEPAIKNTIKDIVGIITCLFGIIELYFLYKYRKEYQNTALQTCATISLLLSPFVTRQGFFLVSLFTTFFSLNGIFSQTTLFADNPWHPKHIASISAVLFATPVLFAKLTGHAEKFPNRVLLFLLFNTLTSRPVLHLGNQLALALM